MIPNRYKNFFKIIYLIKKTKVKLNNKILSKRFIFRVNKPKPLKLQPKLVMIIVLNYV